RSHRPAAARREALAPVVGGRRLGRAAGVAGGDRRRPGRERGAGPGESQERGPRLRGQFLPRRGLCVPVRDSAARRLPVPAGPAASLLRDQRGMMHARIVGAIERLYHDRRTSHVDQLAFHATRGEVWVKALIYNRLVGVRAVLHAANGEAVEAFQDALAALKRLPETRETTEQAIDLRLDLRPPPLPLGRLDDVLRVSREAERLASDLGDEARLARVYTYLINYHYLKGETKQAIEYGQRCLEVGRAIGDAALQGLARQYMGQSYHAQGDYERAERALRENIEATARDQATISYVASCGWL